MCTGWVKVDGHWYYMDQCGAMYTGWLYMWDQETEKFKDYYFASDGRWKVSA